MLPRAASHSIDDAIDIFVLLFCRSLAEQVVANGNWLKSGRCTHAGILPVSALTANSNRKRSIPLRVAGTNGCWYQRMLTNRQACIRWQFVIRCELISSGQ